MEEQGCWLKTAVEGQTLTIRAGGEWTVERAGQLDELVGGLPMGDVQAVHFDVSSLTALDTAGAWIMRRTVALFEDKGIASEIAGLDPAYKPLLDIVDEANKQPHEPLREEPHFILAMFERVGRTLCDALSEAKMLVNFFGLTISTLVTAIAKPKRLRPVALINQIEQTGLNAVPIVCLLNFLIGIVIAGNVATKFFSVVALAFSVLTFFSKLYPTIRMMDEAGQIVPHGYSRTLGIMIASFVGMFAASAVVFLVFFQPG